MPSYFVGFTIRYFIVVISWPVKEAVKIRKVQKFQYTIFSRGSMSQCETSREGVTTYCSLHCSIHQRSGRGYSPRYNNATSMMEDEGLILRVAIRYFVICLARSIDSARSGQRTRYTKNLANFCKHIRFSRIFIKRMLK